MTSSLEAFLWRGVRRDFRFRRDVNRGPRCRRRRCRPSRTPCRVFWRTLRYSHRFFPPDAALPKDAIQVLHSRAGSGLTCKHKTRLERLAKDKHSSLLRKYVNYGCKKFYNTGPWRVFSPKLKINRSKLECWFPIGLSSLVKCKVWSLP
jgi:hypothetical protein